MRVTVQNVRVQKNRRSVDGLRQERQRRAASSSVRYRADFKLR